LLLFWLQYKFIIKYILLLEKYILKRYLVLIYKEPLMFVNLHDKENIINEDSTEFKSFYKEDLVYVKGIEEKIKSF